MNERTLKLVLTDHWFDEIKSGRKTHEYRKAIPFWIKRIEKAFYVRLAFSCLDFIKHPIYMETLEEFMPFIELQRAYRKNPERMIFRAKRLEVVDGKQTDLKCDGPVFDIELGERIK